MLRSFWYLKREIILPYKTTAPYNYRAPNENCNKLPAKLDQYQPVEQVGFHKATVPRTAYKLKKVMNII